MAITLDISGGVDGVWTLEDDGTPGNGISVLRTPSGTIFQTFAHPADAVTLISRVGQSIVVNLTDSLTTANFTIGSLTVPGQRPDNIQVTSVLTSGIVTLTANNAISEFGSDATSDITAGTLFLDAGTGIGASNPIETQVSLLEAESVTGGINLNNTGNVTIGGAGGTGDLRGLFTQTSGNIRLINAGSITLSDVNNAQTIASAGNITLNAIGAAADISANVNNDSLLAIGNIALTAGRDVLFGRAGPNFDNDVRAGGSIQVNAGRDFAIDGNADMLSNDLGLDSGGGISIVAGRDILIDDTTGTSASVAVSASSGAIFLQTGIGGTLLLHANSSAAIGAGSGGVLVRADRVLIEGDSGISVTSGGTLILTTSSAGRAITLGTATDGLFAMELSDAELDRLFSANVTIGALDSGPISIDGAITHPNNNLTIRSGEDLFINASVTVPQTLSLVARENIFQTAGTITATTLLASIDSPDLDTAGATLTIGGLLSTTANLLQGGADDDTIIGNANNNTINGGGGNDILQGGGGADSIAGGLGNDTYRISDTLSSLTENPGEGTDTIQILAGPTVFTIPVNFENLTFLNNLQHGGTGNAADNVMIGGQGKDQLEGLGGNDTLNDGGGSVGNEDTLFGGQGNDIYIVGVRGTSTIELAGEGIDEVRTAFSVYELQPNVENLMATDNGTHGALIGNDLANVITGGTGGDDLFARAGNDTLIGGTGSANTMFGQQGDDVYIVQAAGDSVIEFAGEGSDTVQTALGVFILRDHVENLVYTGFGSFLGIGSASNNTIVGGAIADDLSGLDGDDLLIGGSGADQLQGGTGSDLFRYLGGETGFDRILDFQANVDKLQVSSAFFSPIGTIQFVSGAGATSNSANATFLYDTNTGIVSFDRDGTGASAAVQLAQLNLGLTLSVNDFGVF